MTPEPPATPRAGTARDLPVAKVLIALNLAFYVYTSSNGGGIAGAGRVSEASRKIDYTLFAPSIAECGEWYRVFTSGFVHFDLMHLGFNMLMLYVVANVLERNAGSARFAIVYVVSLITGALGALILDPNAQTGGASGAVFGVAGAATLLMMRHGITFWNTGFGPLLVLNLVYTFVTPNVSLGGHVGGLIGGVVTGLIVLRRDATPASAYVSYATASAFGVVAFAACLWTAERASELPFCIHLR